MAKQYERHPDEYKTGYKRGHPYFYDQEEIEYYLDTAGDAEAYIPEEFQSD